MNNWYVSNMDSVFLNINKEIKFKILNKVVDTLVYMIN